MKKICKHIFMAFFALCLIIGLSSCTSGDKPADSNENEHLKICCATFPQYDWTRNIVGDNPAGFNLQLINDTGVDMHSYQPSAEDLVSICDADLLIYTGGISENWISDALNADGENASRAMALMNETDAKTELIINGMEEEKHENDDAAEDDEYDEHVWLSLKLAKEFCGKITEKICELDPANSDYYESNSADYISKLAELDNRYADKIQETGRNTVLFADRFPFRYMMDDYRINYFAAFPGCSAETEASFETIVFLADKLNEYDLKNLIILENSKKSMAQTIIENSEKKSAGIVVMNSMQSVSVSDIESGTTYLDIMQDNLDALILALQ